MGNKKRFKSGTGGLVYSTNEDYMQNEDGDALEFVPPEEQRLKVRLDTKHRGGKTVTLIEGFEGNDDQGKALVKLLKQKCGTGGSYKDGELIIQGNEIKKVIEVLKKEGYHVA